MVSIPECGDIILAPGVLDYRQLDPGTSLCILTDQYRRSRRRLLMSHPLTRIHFIRHGMVHNPQGIFYGRLPRYPLSAEGRHQAEAGAQWFAGRPIVTIYSSPMLRARQTAQAVAARLPGLRVRINQDLNEVHVPIQGLPLEEGIARGWDLYTGNQPPYESVADILQRMLHFTQETRKRHSGQEIVAVTHGDPVGFLMLWAQGRPVTAENKAPLYQRYLAVGSVTTLTFTTASAEEKPTLEYTVPYPGPATPI
jgi:broad specificity phosphatase PhoE